MNRLEPGGGGFLHPTDARTDLPTGMWRRRVEPLLLPDGQYPGTLFLGGQ